MAEQVAIVTGAGGGIGRAIAIELSRRAYSLVLVGRTDATLQETLKAIHSRSPRGMKVQILVSDISKPESADFIVSQTLAQFGRIDALINNAGSAPVRTIEQTTPEIWRQVIDTNLSGPFYLCRAAWPIFRKLGGGVVVNISSLSAKDPFRGFAAYGAAKAGLNTLGIALAEEGQPIGVRVYTVAPGAVETTMLRTVVSKDQLPTEQTLSPEQIAHVVGKCVAGEENRESGEVIWLTR